MVDCDEYGVYEEMWRHENVARLFGDRYCFDCRRIFDEEEAETEVVLYRDPGGVKQICLDCMGEYVEEYYDKVFTYGQGRPVSYDFVSEGKMRVGYEGADAD